MNIDTLEGKELDRMVSLLFHEDVSLADGGFTPSTRWHDGGPIIEQEKIDVGPMTDAQWSAEIWIGTREEGEVISAHGPTPLIAAMRCYVKSRLGARAHPCPECRGEDLDCPVTKGKS